MVKCSMSRKFGQSMQQRVMLLIIIRIEKYYQLLWSVMQRLLGRLIKSKKKSISSSGNSRTLRNGERMKKAKQFRWILKNELVPIMFYEICLKSNGSMGSCIDEGGFLVSKTELCK